MRLTPLLLSLFCLGCVSSEDAGDADPKDSSVPDTDTDTTNEDSGDPIDSGDVASLYGVPPKNPISRPEFSATNYDGSSRGPDNLEGVRTVLWFFPAAGTYG